MDFTDEQMVAIGEMIASKVDEQTTALSTQLETLRTNNQNLVNEKRQRTTDAEQERARADEAERQRLEASGDLDGFRNRVKTLEERLTDRETRLADYEAEIKKSKFDRAISDAVTSKNIRSELRGLLTDSLKLNAKYDAASGTTTVNGLTVEEHIDDILKSEAGKFYLPANGNTGGNAPGSTSSARGIQMTKENFDGDKFFTYPKGERDAWAAQHRPDLVGVE